MANPQPPPQGNSTTARPGQGATNDQRAQQSYYRPEERVQRRAMQLESDYRTQARDLLFDANMPEPLALYKESGRPRQPRSKVLRQKYAELTEVGLRDELSHCNNARTYLEKEGVTVPLELYTSPEEQSVVQQDRWKRIQARQQVEDQQPAQDQQQLEQAGQARSARQQVEDQQLAQDQQQTENHRKELYRHEQALTWRLYSEQAALFNGYQRDLAALPTSEAPTPWERHQPKPGPSGLPGSPAQQPQWEVEEPSAGSVAARIELRTQELEEKQRERASQQQLEEGHGR